MMGYMEDKAYARALLEILTNPHPTGVDPDDPYGLADDGIDRYDGFGRDVWVASLEVVDSVHGAELVVEFEVRPPSGPDWRSVPPRGLLRLPFDAKWRELSGYVDPATYAPVVARQTQSAAHTHVEHHRRRGAGRLVGDQGRPALPSREAQWQILLGALNHEGVAQQVSPGRIDVRTSDGTVVTFVVSPDQWERVLVEHASGDVGSYFADLLGPREDDQTFVVFYNGDLTRSTREKLPPVRGGALGRRLAQARAEPPEAKFGWYAHPPETPGRRPQA